MSHPAVHIFTSITSNYLPKARVLAHSVKRLMPDAVFHLMLCDDPPPGWTLDGEPFDHLIRMEDLGIPDLRQWVFGHTVVELCTAAKGAAFRHLFERHGVSKAMYFDPDMVVFSRLDELVGHLDRHSILLTPHQTVPDSTLEAIADNEIASLKHGSFNLGFLAVRASDEGRRFIDWWAHRLQHFCHDDPVNGLFTDQRWINLAPCFFSDLLILRDAGFNVATWNLSTRPAGGSMAEGVTVGGEPLGFYHFSGMDSGAQEVMLNKYGAGRRVLSELRTWYLEECERMGQSALGRLPARGSRYDDGTPIEKAQRVLYRNRIDLRQAFPDPFSTAGEHGGYLGWYQRNHGTSPPLDERLVLTPELRYTEAAANFLAFTHERLMRTHRVPRWGKSAVAPVLRLVQRMLSRPG